MVFMCELPNEVQKEIKKDLTNIVKKLGLEFPFQADDISYYETIGEYVEDLMNEKLKDMIGTEMCLDENGNEFNVCLDWDKYKKFL